jgi:hypothetical protein
MGYKTTLFSVFALVSSIFILKFSWQWTQNIHCSKFTLLSFFIWVTFNLTSVLYNRHGMFWYSTALLRSVAITKWKYYNFAILIISYVLNADSEIYLLPPLHTRSFNCLEKLIHWLFLRFMCPSGDPGNVYGWVCVPLNAAIPFIFRFCNLARNIVIHQ